MKIFSLLVSVIAAENSLIVGTEQAECGGELCGTQHGRNKGSQVCMRETDENFMAELIEHCCWENGIKVLSLTGANAICSKWFELLSDIGYVV